MRNSFFCSLFLHRSICLISNRLFLPLLIKYIPFGGYVHRPVLFSKCDCRHLSSKYCVSLPYYIHITKLHTLPHEMNFKARNVLETDEWERKFSALKDKILFNSVLQLTTLNRVQQKVHQERQKKLRINEINKRDPISNVPIALKYIKQTENSIYFDKKKDESDLENERVCLPYSIKTEHYEQSLHNMSSEEAPELPTEKLSTFSLRDETSKSGITNWMSDYECYEELEEDYDINEQPWELNYGTPNVDIPSSNVPCGGCGALLHCQDTAIPGYLPSEIFENQDDATLRSIVCQRCHFMRHYDTALNVIVSPNDYSKMMSHIKEKVALIVLMVDLLDFPCSIWPGIMDIISEKHPVVVVGNKVDLLPPDSRGYLQRIVECLTNNLYHCGIPEKNIKHVALISAKTGYGVEEFITKLHNSWSCKGDVYLVGCTNVGKSTLFNALLQSDFCKVKAVDLVQRATTSPWPGTTINLLKFPILRPAGWKLYERVKRIMSEKKDIQAERKLRRNQLQENASSGMPALIGHIGMTFYQKSVAKQMDPFDMGGRVRTGQTPVLGLDPSDESFRLGKWCYDTPGVVHPDQVIHLLTTEELLLTLPKNILIPRTYRLSPSMSLFIAGLGRIDYLEGDGPVRMTVFASNLLPITICRTEDAEELYSNLLGSKFLAVPKGGEVRLAQWPGLEPHGQIVELEGNHGKESCGDVLLSSAGWIALTFRRGEKGQFRGWTPNAKGVHVRKPSLLPFAVNLCGPKVRNSPAYQRGKAFYSGHV